MGHQQGETVFISHGHEDRGYALDLARVLKANGAEPFLDQEQFAAGDALPIVIKEAIISCGKFLLLWSAAAAGSSWVGREWVLAYESQKRLIPYALDATPLPDALQNFVFLDREDADRGHSGLLKAVLGVLPAEAKGVDVFPGRWRLDFDIPDGSGHKVVYEIELRPNGQVDGVIRQEQAGALGLVSGMLKSEGLDLGFLFQTTPVRGNWSYKSGGMLTLELVQEAYGQRFPIRMEIHRTARAGDVLAGTGPGGVGVTMRRQSGSGGI